MEQFDETDLRILRALQANARLTIKEIAAKVHLSTTPVYERLRRLENKGVLKKYVAIIDAEKLGCGFQVFCNVKMDKLNTSIAAEFAEAVAQIPEVTECYNISGNFDFMLKVHALNMKAYQQLIFNHIGRLPHVTSIESTFVMDELKQSYGINI